MASKSRGGSRSPARSKGGPSRKTAMVQPIASRAGGAHSSAPTRAPRGEAPIARASDLPIFADPALEAKLVNTLQLMGNDRAYTVLEYHATWAWVHFEGDAEAKTITYKTK